ncbi:MAG: hypothetical protein ABSG53_32495, partial [Thermoguttaceae bacterium]
MTEQAQQAQLPPQPQQQAESAERKPKARLARRYVAPPDPVLRFSPTAWAKLLFFRDLGETEVGGFGITAADDLLRIEEFCTVKQDATVASIVFDDLAVADFFEVQVDQGRKPEQFGRVWLHTHPGDSAQPSLTDEETFGRVFGRCQWAVMFIVAQSNHCFARLRFNVGPGGELEIPVEVDYSRGFGSSAFDAWEAEYKAHVRPEISLARLNQQRPFLDEELWASQAFPDEWIEDLEMMEPAQRQLVLDELAARQAHAPKESEAS